MRFLNRFWLVVFLMPFFSVVAIAAAPTQKLDEGMVNPGYVEKPDWFKLSLMELPEDVSEAASAGKRVMLYFYQDGCPYCSKLVKDNFTRKDIVEKLKTNFDAIAINMWGDKEVIDVDGQETIEKEFAKKLKVMYTPTILFLNEKGEVALRINGYYYPDKFSAALEYVAGKMEKKMKFLQYYKSIKTASASDKLHVQDSYLQPPYNLQATAKKNQRPLLVLFEERSCKMCDELHLDIMKKPEVIEAIKPFDVVLLDKNSRGFVTTPKGKQIRISAWAKQLSIQHMPSLVFFDTQGDEVFRTEAYLRTFHIAGAMTYVSSAGYKAYPSFQRYLQKVNEEMIKKGMHVDLLR